MPWVDDCGVQFLARPKQSELVSRSGRRQEAGIQRLTNIADENEAAAVFRHIGNMNTVNVANLHGHSFQSQARQHANFGADPPSYTNLHL